MPGPTTVQPAGELAHITTRRRLKREAQMKHGNKPMHWHDGVLHFVEGHGRHTKLLGPVPGVAHVPKPEVAATNARHDVPRMIPRHEAGMRPSPVGPRVRYSG